MSLLERTSCDGPPASTDCSIRDGAVMLPGVEPLLLADRWVTYVSPMSSPTADRRARLRGTLALDA
jgi:hypothetical protein